MNIYTAFAMMCATFLAGGFLEYCATWDTKAQLNHDLRESFREADLLREEILARDLIIRRSGFCVGDCA